MSTFSNIFSSENTGPIEAKFHIKIVSDFKEIVLKLATNDRSDKMFRLTLKFRPQGDVRPCRGAIYMYKIMKKNIYKIRLQRYFF